MTTDRISIIIPVYNVENYLEECLESIQHQTYSNFEVIMVDDGSTDSSAEIAQKFVDSDVRFKLIHQENGGAGKARNTALDGVDGEYILFVDSDDIIHPKMCEWLLEQNSDIAFADYSVNKDNVLRVENITTRVLTTKEAAGELLLGKIEVGSCAKLFKKSLWDNIRFPENKKYEDYYTTHKAFLAAEKIVGLKEALYYYRRDREGQTTGKINDGLLETLENKKSLIDDIVSVYPDLEKYKVACFYPTLIYIKSRFDMERENVSKEARDLIDKQFKKYQVVILTDPYISKGTKVNYLLQKLGLFGMVRKIYKLFTK